MSTTSFFKGITVALLTLSASAIVGCSAASSDDGLVTESAADLSREDAISRAEEWVSARLPYCQSANHQADGDKSCSAVCERVDNAAWDPYRSDCSGLVSWSWGLPAPGRVTTEFAPFVNDITKAIPASDLQAGDAVNNADHVMLFKSWVTPGSVATFVEEPGCSASTPFAHEFTSSVSISGSIIHVAYNGMTFTAIRYTGISGDSAAPAAPAADAFVITPTKSGNGYWESRPDGAVFSFGDAAYHGGANTFAHPTPIVGMARSGSGAGYWQVAQDGAIYSFGDAAYHGGVNTIPHSTPVVAITSTPGSGYWVFTADGATYSFGDAPYYGGANSEAHAPIIAANVTPSGKGYWMLAQDGAIYSFGDAAYRGGANTIAHPAAIVGFAPTTGSGYWIVAADGAIYSFGDAQYRGGANTISHSDSILGIGADNDGYWIVGGDGAIYSFGDAAYHGGANAL